MTKVSKQTRYLKERNQTRPYLVFDRDFWAEFQRAVDYVNSQVDDPHKRVNQNDVLQILAEEWTRARLPKKPTT